MSSQPNPKPNAVRYFDSEQLHITISLKEIATARRCLNEAQLLIESKPGMGQGTRDQVAELYSRLYQLARSQAGSASQHLELIRASQILRGEIDVIELPDFPFRRGVRSGSTRPPARAA